VNSATWRETVGEAENTPVGGYGIDEDSSEVGANGTNNRITVTNHSNNAVNAKFAYAMLNQSAQEGAAGYAVSPFNDGGKSKPTESYGEGLPLADSYDAHGPNDVIGRFYGNNENALKAHALVAGTFKGGENDKETEAGGTAQVSTDSWKYDDGYNESADYTEIASMPEFLSVYAKANSEAEYANLADTVVFPTADRSSNFSIGGRSWWSPMDASDVTVALYEFHNDDDYDEEKVFHSDARSANVYFAFSGRPDTDQGKYLSGFTKVGTITVTISPNDAPEYNTMATEQVGL
jgi:hypothetical protein